MIVDRAIYIDGVRADEGFCVWRYGYLLVLLVMVTLTAALFRAFRRHDWL